MLKLKLKNWWRHTWLNNVGLMPTRRLLLWLALGPSTYGYMTRTLVKDPRLKTARMADIVVRKDAIEKRIEADWLKDLYKIVVTPKVQAESERIAAEVQRHMAPGPWN